MSPPYTSSSLGDVAVFAPLKDAYREQRTGAMGVPNRILAPRLERRLRLSYMQKGKGIQVIQNYRVAFAARICGLRLSIFC